MTAITRAGRFWMMDPPAPLVPEIAGVRFGRLGPAAAGEVAAAFGSEAGAEFGARLAAGRRRAYALWKDGVVAVMGWASFTPEHIGEQGLWVRLRPGEAYLWDCVTQPAMRRQGLYRALLAHMAAALLAEGCLRLWIGAELGNEPSQRGMAGAGFRPVVDLLVTPLGGRQLLWLERLPGATDEQTAAAQYALFGERARGVGRRR